jgi:hypothetical protein
MMMEGFDKLAIFNADWPIYITLSIENDGTNVGRSIIVAIHQSELNAVLIVLCFPNGWMKNVLEWKPIGQLRQMVSHKDNRKLMVQKRI